MKVLFWRSLVVLFVILGFIGAILPGMPTTVFLILAAWAASKGWPQMDDWLLNHPKYGPTLRDWRAHGTVPRKAKWLASIMMLISGIIMLFTTAPLAVKAFTNITMLIVAIWLWRRPEPDQVMLHQETIHPEKTEIKLKKTETKLKKTELNKVDSENNKS